MARAQPWRLGPRVSRSRDGNTRGGLQNSGAAFQNVSLISDPYRAYHRLPCTPLLAEISQMECEWDEEKHLKPSRERGIGFGDGVESSQHVS